jgi:hypothetical protein
MASAEWSDTFKDVPAADMEAFVAQIPEVFTQKGP